MKISKRLLAVSTLVAVLFASHQANATFTQMISFGDSFSDTGNRYIASNCPSATCQVPSPPFYNGRESDGPVYNERLAGMLGITAPTPSLNGGTNYSISGARVLQDTEWLGVQKPSIQSQVNQYLSDNNGVADPNAIFTIAGGANDLQAIITGERTVADLQAAAAGFVSITQQLVDAGANYIAAINLPDIGMAPIAEGNEFTASYLTAVSFNMLMEPGLNAISQVNLLDVFAALNSAAADPGAFGFTNVEDNCQLDIAAGITNDCSGYVFMDEWHPSATAHQFLADSLYADAALASASAVPVPAALPLFASALVGLGFFRRKA